MINDDKGQVSIEFILVVGAILTMVIVSIPIILKNAEMNRGLTAARDGATFAVAMRGLGFSSGEENEAGLLKIDRLDVSIKENPDSLDNVSISIYIKGPAALNTPSVHTTIRTQTKRYILYSFSGQWKAGAAISDSELRGSYYDFSDVNINSSTWINT